MRLTKIRWSAARWPTASAPQDRRLAQRRHLAARRVREPALEQPADGREQEVAVRAEPAAEDDERPTSVAMRSPARAAVKIGIVRSPSVFLMDEPLSNLDAKLRVQMRTDIAASRRGWE